jgi:hypothetical protein
MNGTDLREYVERSQDALDGASNLSLRNTELRLVHPFLSVLGWDVHRREVEADVRVPADRDPVDYALRVEGRLAVFVDVAACADSLDEASVDRLDAALSAAGVDWGILTNGRSFVFLARSGGDTGRVRCRLADLPGHENVVTQYSKAAAESRTPDDEERTAAAQRLGDRREAVAERLTETLVAAADGAAEGDLASAVDAFLDDLIDALDANAPSSGSTERGGSDADGTTDTDRVESPPEATPDGRAATTGGDGEYVVRFFDGRTSVGAVGTGSPAGTLSSAVEYLVDQHAVDGGISLPWRPDAGDDPGKAVLNHDPVHPDGSPMPAHETLSNGYRLLTTLDAASTEVVIEELASKAGLRVMFQGDW